MPESPKRDAFRAVRLVLVLAVVLCGARLVSVNRAPAPEKKPPIAPRIESTESVPAESAPVAGKARTTHEAP